MNENKQEYFPYWYVDETARAKHSNVRIIGCVSEETLDRLTY